MVVHKPVFEIEKNAHLFFSQIVLLCASQIKRFIKSFQFDFFIINIIIIYYHSLFPSLKNTYFEQKIEKN